MKNRRQWMYFHSRHGRIELLEPRNMLSGHALGGGISHAFRNSFTMVPSQIRSVHSSSGDFTSDAHIALTAALNDPNSGATGSVTYQTGSHCGTTSTRFTVTVTGATADSSFDVSIDGTVIGQITTDSNGAGVLKLSSQDSTLPSNFPTSVAAGSVITVGALTGTLTTPTSNDDSDSDSDHCAHGNRTTLTTDLTDSSGSGTGTAIYKTHTRDGSTITAFKISVTGAAAGSTLDVAIDGTVVGQLSTDSSGAGALKLSSTDGTLPANFPAVNSGSVVTVGTLSGTFADATGAGYGSRWQFARRWNR